MFLISPQGFFKTNSAQGFERRGSQYSQLQEMGIEMAEMVRGLRTGTPAIELAIRRNSSEEDR
jgi:hypothetical protein